MERAVAQLLERALARRAPLAADPLSTAYRVLNGAGDGMPGLTVDRYGPLLVVNQYEQEADAPALAALLEALAALRLGEAIYLRRRPREASRVRAEDLAARAPGVPVWGAGGPAAEVLEHGLRYLARMDEGLSSGLFLDMREVRRALGGWAAGKTVLNTFAYSCAFGVAALAGGATRVLNLDAARPALDWGKRNYALNGLAVDDYDFVYGDVFDWLGRFARRGERFDIVILDPPSYSTTRSTRWVLERQYDALVELAARATAPGGLLLACANHRGVSRARLERLVLKGLAAAGRRATVEGRLGAPELDFPPPPDGEDALKVLALRF
jgi:23S rRNA (cytosine1962-C5)-methyltransferase